jgi:hypothetical protein
MKVGDKVWVYLGGFWEKAVVVPQPANMAAKQGRVFVWVENDQDVYRYNKQFVKERND